MSIVFVIIIYSFLDTSEALERIQEYRVFNILLKSNASVIILGLANLQIHLEELRAQGEIASNGTG